MRRTSLVTALAVTASLALAACGSNSLSTNTGPSSAPSGTVKVDAASAALVPAAIKAKGTLVVGTDASYAPSEILAADGTTIQGFDIDLFKKVAATLGLKAQFENASFGSIITGVTSGKYDLGVSSFSITAEREKSVNMVSYYSAGTAWATAVGNPKKISIDNACGLNIAVQTLTTQADDIKARSAACTSKGKPAIHIDSYDKQDAATANVVSGRDDAMLADSPVIAYAVKKTSGKLQTLGAVYASAPYGYEIPKSQTKLAEAILSALKVLKANGGYEAVLTNWGVQQGAISDFALNPPVK